VNPVRRRGGRHTSHTRTPAQRPSPASIGSVGSDRTNEPRRDGDKSRRGRSRRPCSQCGLELERRELATGLGSRKPERGVYLPLTSVVPRSISPSAASLRQVRRVVSRWLSVGAVPSVSKMFRAKASMLHQDSGKESGSTSSAVIQRTMSAHTRNWSSTHRWTKPCPRSVRNGGPYVGYDAGGLLPPGPSLVYNGTGQHELVAPVVLEVLNGL
jgi:hypothetical protein